MSRRLRNLMRALEVTIARMDHDGHSDKAGLMRAFRKQARPIRNGCSRFQRLGLGLPGRVCGGMDDVQALRIANERKGMDRP